MAGSPSRRTLIALTTDQNSHNFYVFSRLATFEHHRAQDETQTYAAMTKHSRVAKLVRGIPQRRGSSIAIDEPGTPQPDAFAFPPRHRLMVTTKKGVYMWDVDGVTEIFRSGSEGIVAAKRVTSGSEMLAVADSQVVVLHEPNDRVHKSYRLKGSEVSIACETFTPALTPWQGRVRLLKYDEESKNLFFTTTLQNAVQSYSLQQSKLLDPSHSHPSPPSVFAVSCNSHFLVSTSVSPPTIHLTDLSRNTPPVLLRPRCSSSSVVAAAFHPDREGFFLLAFADGTAAVFNALHFYRVEGKGDHQRSGAVSGSGGEIAFIKGLHAIGTSSGTSKSNNDGFFDGYDPGTGITGIGSRANGITAVAFVPGRSATAVTVGTDGKCCVVDFTQLTKPRAVLLRSWHVRRPATSLSIICSSQRPAPNHFDGSDEGAPSRGHGESHECFFIAIGRQDGRVLLFDLNGKSLGIKALDADGSRIIDVEWTAIDRRRDDAERLRRTVRPTVPRTTKVTTNSKGTGKSMTAPSHLRSDDLLLSHVDARFDFSTAHETAVPIPTTESHKPDLISSAAKSSDDITIGSESPAISNGVSPTAYHIPSHRRRGSESSTGTASIGSQHAVAEETSTPPPIPPRPTPKPGGRLFKRRAQTANQSPTSLGVVSEARRMTYPRVTGAIFGPRTPPSHRTQTLSTKTTAPTLPAPDSKPKTYSTDVAPSPPYHRAPELPQRQAPMPPGHSTKISPVSSETIKSYKTASSQFPSETSDDTVIDWSVGLARQPVPTLQISPQTKSPKQKGHISLPISSTSRETSLRVSSMSEYNTSPIAQALTRSLKQPLPLLQITYASGEYTSKRAPKQKGHISMPISPETTGPITPISASSEDQIVQWPSLKKSPRISELSRGLQEPSPDSSPETVKESVTGIVLEGYTKSPSLSKPPKLRPSQVLLPPSIATSSEAEPYHCTCAATLESTIHASLADLRADMMHQFEAQKIWFEKMSKGEENERKMLAAENRWLRNELARIEKKQGLVSVDEQGLKVRDV